MKNVSNNGITLIALIITIIVLLIIAGVGISLFFSDGLFSSISETEFKHEMSTFKEQTNLYALWQITETSKTDISYINAGELLKSAVNDGIVTDINIDEVRHIEDILKDIPKGFEEFIVIYKGELHYVSNGEEGANQDRIEWCKHINVPILNYIEPEEEEIVTGIYTEIKGVYMNTPDLGSTEFDRNETRYMKLDVNGNLIPGDWIIDKPDENWYDYNNSQWANMYVENNGAEAYFVWIPRYVYKVDTDTQKTDAKFVDLDNSYKQSDGNSDTAENATSWADLQAQGYQLPEAFTFEGIALPGYWISKYTIGEPTGKTIVSYDYTMVNGEILVSNINSTNSAVATYTIALNNKIIHTINENNISGNVYTLSNLKVGDNDINVTALDSDGKIIGSMSRVYSPVIVNKPELSNFNQDTTFYVTWDAQGNEYSNIPISEPVPSGWYEYGLSNWANIVVRNNDLEAYYTWIPRYEYRLDQANSKTVTNFISGTAGDAGVQNGGVTEGFSIPEAFVFENKQLSGYWLSKYTIGSETALQFKTDFSTTSSSIRFNGITGVGVASNQVYKYYLNGELKGEKGNASDIFEFVNLENNKLYTINIEIRDSSNKYLGSITKQIKTADANKPDLEGFNTDVTYYIVYDEEGNAVKGDKIKSDGSNAPTNWYNYSESEWANIVVDNNGMLAYYVWIPRYEYYITPSEYLNGAYDRGVDIRFLPDTSTVNSPGFEIPEAFNFGGKELRGYWMSKYTIGE